MTVDERLDSDVDVRASDEPVVPAGGKDDLTSTGWCKSKPSGGDRFSSVNSMLVVSVVMVLGLAGLAGWLGYRAHQSSQGNQLRALLLETARQEAVNLTTISYTEVDADIKRIVDSTTGRFHDDFQQRSPAFIEVVKQAQAKSVGTVTAAGLESISRDQARVLVAVSVKTSNAGAQEQQPRAWRMRVGVVTDRDGAKVSDVQFVP